MQYQIEQHVAQRLKDFFSKFDYIEKVVVFGSRAKHTANPKSDIDLCIYAQNMSSTQFSMLKMEIDELPILYKLDVVHFENSDEALKENIIRDGKLLYINRFSFDSFFTNVSSKPYQILKKDYLEEGKYPVVDQGQKFIVGYTNDEKKLFSDKPIIIFGDHTRIIKYVDFDFVIGADGTKILIPVDDSIDCKYAYYQLLYTRIENLGYSRHYKLLKEKTFIKPPLPKQKAIAQKLDLAQKLIDLRKESIAKLDDLAKSVFVDMFGDPVENPKKYKAYLLEELTNRVTDGEHQTPKRTDKGTLLLSARNIQQGYIDIYNEKVDYIGKDEVSRIHKRLKIEKNDILLSCSGTIGRVSLNTLNQDFCLVRSVAVIKSNEDMIIPKFLVEYLQTNFMQTNMKTQANSAGQPNLFQKQIKKLKIYLPPITLQTKFAQIIQKIEDQKALYEQELVKLEESFEGLLQESFA